MNRAITQFEANLESARQLGVIFKAFHGKVTEAIPLDELLRAEIVLVVSALDCYVHDVVRQGMVKTLSLTSGESNAYLAFGVSMHFVKRLLRATESGERANLLDHEVRRLHGFKTFQTSDNISKALSLVGITDIWSKVGVLLGIPAIDVKTRLNLIIDRRNKIAHEGDIDHSMGLTIKYPIDFPTIQKVVTFLESLVKNMHNVILTEAGGGVAEFATTKFSNRN